jgi:hypothetical protein
MRDTREKGVPFWSMDYMNLLPASAWMDDWHLQITGSVAFSDWLGQQVGAAMQIDDLPLNFPAPTYPLERITTSFRDLYLQQPDPVIFNPASGEYERQLLGDSLSLYLDWSIEIDDDERQHLEHLLNSLAQMRYESELTLTDEPAAALSEWRNTKQPELLKAAGVDYLIISDTWVRWLADDELAIIYSRYQQVDSWGHPVLDEGYYLLRID